MDSAVIGQQLPDGRAIGTSRVGRLHSGAKHFMCQLVSVA